MLTLILAGLGINAIDEATSDSNSDATPTPSPSPEPTPRPAPTPGSTPFPTPEPVVYKGIRIFAGQRVEITGEMSFVEAIAWAYMAGETKLVGKNTSWGIYTNNRTDAYLLALTLGNFQEPVHDYEYKVGHYDHYHVFDRVFLNEYKHFHVWYGMPK